MNLSSLSVSKEHSYLEQASIAGLITLSNIDQSRARTESADGVRSSQHLQLFMPPTWDPVHEFSYPGYLFL
jgi:hypothetical protein